ncbi:hypothetical protein C4K22_6097 [Pseudomonas chlororaphis subsp. aurantiaca]|nr:hypothetical protein C4K22_6097 [Pseudomonas chlororaphis subsp. aurantiaca]AZD45136.1 hypothetical protein C4K21_6107 [Pseudomonas chlororaphis subsp. aurantiaca]AZD82527.1 hypothetical protein C4K15_6005 [Pseudomonas chlororaphis subsp. aurantiaca]
MSFSGEPLPQVAIDRNGRSGFKVAEVLRTYRSLRQRLQR